MRLASIFMAIAIVGVGSTGTRAEDVLKVATEGGFPPFNWREADGTLRGFDVDIANALCDKLNRKCEIVGQDWDGMIPSLLAKKFDIIVASMSITDDRRKRVDFTTKYWEAVPRFAAKKGVELKVDSDDVGGVRLGVQRGTIHACYVAKHFPKAQVAQYPSLEEAFSDLKAGRVDTILSETIQMKKELLDKPGGEPFAFTGPAPQDPACFGEGVGIALRKGDDQLREALNKAILDIRADGTYQKIGAQYFDFDVYGPEANQKP